MTYGDKTGSQMLPNSSSPCSCQRSQSLGISFPCLFSVARTQKPQLVNLSDFSNNPDSCSMRCPRGRKTKVWSLRAARGRDFATGEGRIESDSSWKRKEKLPASASRQCWKERSVWFTFRGWTSARSLCPPLEFPRL